jgi:hypothetical protein
MTLRIDDSAADDPDGAQLRPCALEVPNPVIVAEVLSSTTPHVDASPWGRTRIAADCSAGYAYR